MLTCNQLGALTIVRGVARSEKSAAPDWSASYLLSMPSPGASTWRWQPDADWFRWVDVLGAVLDCRFKKKWEATSGCDESAILQALSDQWETRCADQRELPEFSSLIEDLSNESSFTVR